MSNSKSLQPAVDLVTGQLHNVENPRDYYEGFSKAAIDDSPLPMTKLLADALHAAALAGREVPESETMDLIVALLRKPEARSEVFFRVSAEASSSGVLGITA